MDRRKIRSIKESLRPFINKLSVEGKGLYTSCITPVVGNDDTSPFTLEVQAQWIDDMECLDAISYLFEKLKEVETDPNTLNSLFAIQVIGMDSEIKCREVNYIILDEQEQFV